MANYYGSARTNWFKVSAEKVEEFKRYFTRLSVKVESDDEGRFALFSEDESGWPNYDPNDDNMESIGFAEQILPWLAPGEVSIMMEVGSEKLRYLNGYACAVHANGEVEAVSLEDAILERAKAKWPEAVITAPSY